MGMQSSQTGQQKRKLGKALDTAKWAVPAAGAAVVVAAKLIPKVAPVIARAIFKK